ncbi:unnamed protein product [Rhizophagus irregularis]|nr:unnamed protein product [Rhizophagus irregularis]CAB5375669.1 unnamed protein product [Rhizophagus irregularis]
MPRKKSNKPKSIRNVSFRKQNAFILFSGHYYVMRRKKEKIRRSKAVKLAAAEWKYKMSNEQKMGWFQLYNERKLMDKIGNDGILLNSKNFELIASTFNSPFIIEPHSLMAGAVETDDDKCSKLFNEIINTEMLAN